MSRRRVIPYRLESTEKHRVSMNTCAKSLLDGIIDYAGLFPPARLPMDEAFSRFVEHRSSDDGWMLARFVCPAARLDELEPLPRDTDHLRPVRPLFMWPLAIALFIVALLVAPRLRPERWMRA